MADACPNCRKSFRVPEGEHGEHECPYCGWCRGWDEEDGVDTEVDEEEEE